MSNQKQDSDKNQLHDLLARFIHHMQMKNYSAATIDLRRRCLNRFTDWCQQRSLEQINHITRPVLQSYQRHLFHSRNARTGQPLKFSTQVSLLTPIRAWFRYLLREGLTETNPAADLELPKEEQKLPTNILTADQVETIMNQPNITTPLGIRDRALLEVLYATAIRRAELIHLDIYDINPDAKTLTIRQGKGGKDRVVPLGDRALRWLNKYNEDIRPELAAHTNSTALFLSCRGRALGTAHLSVMVRDYILAAGITRPGSCHLFRHSAATQMLENGADIRCIQQLLGHSKITSTQIYTHVSIKRLKDVHAATHPANLDRKDSEQDSQNDIHPDSV